MSHSFPAQVWQLFILVTTSNFPDVMQRAYAKNRATFLFFALFLVLCLWFLLNVVLAVVSDGYTTSTAAEAALAAASKRRNLDDAYDILLSLERRDGRGVSRDAMARLFGELNATASVPHLDGDAQALVFAVLDHDGSMAVDKAEFELLVDALKLRFVRVDDRPDAASLRGRVAAVVGDARFDRCVDALLVANLVFEAAYGAKSLEARSPADVDGRPDTPAQIASAVFTLVYLAELVARCVARNGVVAYLCRTSLQASFDGCATLAAVALTAYVYYPNGFSEADVIRYALLARTLRLVRVFDGVPAFHKVAAALRRVLPKARTLFAALLWIGFAFAAVAVAAFGGKITRDEHSAHFRAISKKAPDFATAADVGYYANSCNDVASALVLLFELLIVNNWFVLASGYVAVTSKAARAFFVAWYVVGVLVVLNLVVSATLDSFISEYKDDAPEGGPGDRSALRRARRQSTMVIDSATVTGTATGLRGAYQVNVAAGAGDAPEARRNLIHRLLDPADPDDGGDGAAP